MRGTKIVRYGARRFLPTTARPGNGIGTTSRSECLNYPGLSLCGSNSRRRSQPDLNTGDGHAAFTNCGGTTFNRSRTNIARSENARQTCLEWAGLVLGCLPRWCSGHARPGFDKSFVVALDFRRQPFGAWFRANHRKNSRCSKRSAFASLRIFQLDLFELFFAGHFADLCLVKDLNVLTRLHPTREIVGHFVGDIFSPNDEQYLGSALGKKHRGLTRGVAAPDDHNRFVATNLTFHCSRRIVNAHVLKLLASF